MAGKQRTRAAIRRASVEREILDAAWTVMARDGAAAVSVREVARAVGLRQQSLTHYYPTKQDLLDALFADGFRALKDRMDRLPREADQIEAVLAVARTVVDYFLDHPARYHLMFQRSIPGFTPSDSSHVVALGCLGVLIDRLSDLGVTAEADVALVRSLISGLAAEQIANDPAGRQFADQTTRGVRAVLHAVADPAGCGT